MSTKVPRMWRYGVLIVGAAAVMAAGCAATDTADVTGANAVPAPDVSLVEASAMPAPAASGEALCARGATPMPAPDPSASFDLNDPEQRARRTLAEQRRPSVVRGVVPEGAVAGAEACVHVLSMEFSLLTAGSRTPPDVAAIEAALRSAGLTNVVISPGPVFVASTGSACLRGDFPSTGPAFIIGPVAEDGSCRK